MILDLLALLAFAMTFLQAQVYLLRFYDRNLRGSPTPDFPAPALMSAWLAELCVVFLCLLLRPLGWIGGRVGRPQGPAGVGRRPVVLIHGWGMNRVCMALLAVRLRRDGRRVYAVNYNSVGPDTEAKADRIAATLREVVRDEGSDTIDIVAHSLGGILVRAIARAHSEGIAFGNVVTLGSPHQGTALAGMMPAALLGQLRPGSQYLAELAAAEKKPFSEHLVSIYSTFDALVLPYESSRLDAALNVQVDLVGHLSLLFSERVYHLIRENIEFDVSDRRQSGRTRA